MKTIISVLVTWIAGGGAALVVKPDEPRPFNPAKDFLSLHYDHAPDKDDGHSAAADRTVLQSLYGCEWIKKHVVAVSGAYGKNANSFNPKSDAVMDAAWNDCGGWLAAHTNREQSVNDLSERWSAILNDGGDIWVKEGGQSDLTADVVKRIRHQSPNQKIKQRIHVVQHSIWNENQTADVALDYAKQQIDYIKITDANRFLNVQSGNDAFEAAARQHPEFGAVWEAAFAYYNPKNRLDFSDTGELLQILGLGEMGIDEFRQRFLVDTTENTPNKPDPGDGR